MARIISFEGCIGAGKTSLTNYFSQEWGLPKVIECYESNPFLSDFYAGKDVKLETEITFLLQHYSQLKDVTQDSSKAWVLADFSIEKDLVYARLNLEGAEFRLFRAVYEYVTERVGIPDVVIYLDASPGLLERRICERGRPYEVKTDASYFMNLSDRARRFFEHESNSEVHFFDVDNVELDPENETLSEIKRKIVGIVS